MKKLIAPLLAATLLVACSPADQPASSPTPTPPAPSATPSDPAQDPLYLEAVEVYKAYFAQMQKMESANFPQAQMPAEWDQWLAGTMRETVSELVKESYRLRGESDVRGATTLTYVKPDPDASVAGSITAIRVCADSRQIELLDKRDGRVIGHGPLVYKEIFFKRFDGKLKGFVQTVKDVEQCPA
ncbi:hypothetical protein [Luteococcus peritonei]|uniref:Nuclear transport factor 2 family protein n=1 Tax=Luteococcus peritonei TaxID=88874 RepID=A0ABW4RVX3_9ACTN